MKLIVATSAPQYWAPQAECLAEAMRAQGHDARVAVPKTIGQFAQHLADILLCIGSGETLEPFLSAVPARHRLLYLIESIPTLDESDKFTQTKLAIHRPYLHDFAHVFVHSRRSIPVLQSLGVRR